MLVMRTDCAGSSARRRAEQGEDGVERELRENRRRDDADQSRRRDVWSGSSRAAAQAVKDGARRTHRQQESRRRDEQHDHADDDRRRGGLPTSDGVRDRGQCRRNPRRDDAARSELAPGGAMSDHSA